MQSEDTYARNHQTLVSLLRRTGGDVASGRRLGLRLGRVLVDQDTGDLVPFAGDQGIEALLTRLHAAVGGEAEYHDGHLMGVSYALAAPSSGTYGSPLEVRVSLGPGGQIVGSVGSTSSVASILTAYEDLDRRIHVAARELGRSYLLVAEGYNPLASSPLDVPLVPRTQWTLLNAYLGQTGRYARDMMRCACSTDILLERGDGDAAVREYRLATALSPLIMFLTDNVRSFRASGARRCPRMVRSLLWDEVDPARCGVVPGTFGDALYEDYARWLEGIDPIYLVDATGEVASTAKKTMRQLMGERVLSGAEALSLTGTVYPYVRLGRYVELLQADSLRPAMASGYAAFIKGLFFSELSCKAAVSLLGDVDERDVDGAVHELRTRGWDATVYGQDAPALVEQLLQIARTALDDAAERRILDNVAELWDFSMVPRDAYVHQEEKADRGW